MYTFPCVCQPPTGEGPQNATIPAAGVGSRHNTGKKHEEGIKHITPQLKAIASRANAVDEALHEFVSAKFCQRLRELDLLDHPLVAREMANYYKLNQRLEKAR